MYPSPSYRGDGWLCAGAACMRPALRGGVGPRRGASRCARRRLWVVSVVRVGPWRYVCVRVLTGTTPHTRAQFNVSARMQQGGQAARACPLRIVTDTRASYAFLRVNRRYPNTPPTTTRAAMTTAMRLQDGESDTSTLMDTEGGAEDSAGAPSNDRVVT